MADKRIIYKPTALETVPDGAVYIVLPINGPAIDAIVQEGFTPQGAVLYDSYLGIALSESVNHQFLGWEI